MDGSVDARQQDKKFIFVRFNTPDDLFLLRQDLQVQSKVPNVVQKVCVLP